MTFEEVKISGATSAEIITYAGTLRAGLSEATKPYLTMGEGTTVTKYFRNRGFTWYFAAPENAESTNELVRAVEMQLKLAVVITNFRNTDVWVHMEQPPDRVARFEHLNSIKATSLRGSRTKDGHRFNAGSSSREWKSSP